VGDIRNCSVQFASYQVNFVPGASKIVGVVNEITAGRCAANGTKSREHKHTNKTREPQRRILLDYGI
jgi:hypothetical protein